MTIFHLAIPTHDLNQSKEFYTKSLGATIGREYGHYVIFNFFGHQVVTHLNPEGVSQEVTMYPRHYGIIFDKREDFDATYKKCKDTGATFFEDLFERYKEQHGWHFSFFVSDTSNNLIEMKYYMNHQDIFN